MWVLEVLWVLWEWFVVVGDYGCEVQVGVVTGGGYVVETVVGGSRAFGWLAGNIGGGMAEDV
jgi:hypothetical protein